MRESDQEKGVGQGLAGARSELGGCGDSGQPGQWAAGPAWSTAAGAGGTDRDGCKETKNVCPTSSFFGFMGKG